MSPHLSLAPAAVDLPLLARTDLDGDFAWRDGQALSLRQFLAQLAALAQSLPAASAALNLAEDRYHFSLLCCALLLRGQTNLLPASRSPAAITALLECWPDAQSLDDRDCLGPLAAVPPLSADAPWPRVRASPALVAHTSGSSGLPQAHARSWALACSAHAGSRARLQDWFGPRFSVLATVPPQHMYGWEFTVLLPLQAEVCVHAARPLFAADIAAALAEMPAPRVLLTTPLHLRSLLAAQVALPPLAGVLSATAPLDPALAAAAEAQLAAPLYEIYGSTETCALATRRSTEGPWWQPLPGIRLRPAERGCLVEADFLPAPLWLGDDIALATTGDRFRLIGRQDDLLEIAGKRMSLAALNHHLLAIPGVEDGVVFAQPADARGVSRMAALVVAPALEPGMILERLRQQVDPVFLPRPLQRVERLPRNETGKLPRQALLAMLARREAMEVADV